MSGAATPFTRPLFVLAGLVVVIAGIKAAEQIMVPFLLAAFIATIAATPVFWLHRYRVPVGIAIALVALALIAVLIGLGALVAPSVAEFREQLPVYERRLGALLQGVLGIFSSFGIDLSADVLDPARALSFAGDALFGIGNVLSNSFLILLTVIFILAETSSFPRKLRDVLTDPDRDLPHFQRFADNVNRYVAIKTTVSIATGILVSGALWLIGVDFPIIWGLVAFMLNYVPTIGSIIAAVPPVLVALVQLGTGSALAVAAVYLTINVVMGNVVEPRFMGRGLGLSTLVVFLSLVFWGWVFGPVGMLLSVPLTVTAKIALEATPTTTWIGHLLGPAEPLVSPGEVVGEP